MDRTSYIDALNDVCRYLSNNMRKVLLDTLLKVKKLSKSEYETLYQAWIK